MIDGGEKDDKIIAVPASKIDPTYDDIKTISDLPKIEQQRLEAFFRVYKELPEGRKRSSWPALMTPRPRSRRSNRPRPGRRRTRNIHRGRCPAPAAFAFTIPVAAKSHVTRQRLSHHIAS